MTRLPGLLALLAAVLAAALPLAAQSSAFQPGPYAAPDGALLLNDGGNYVEPYFATKALLAAADGGLDVRQASLAWIQWLMPKQRHDGRFERYCRRGDAWKACGAADADDSMLALWLELLYRTAPESGLPAEWQASAAVAQKYLATLRSGRLGVYHVSHKNHSALFMDNVEVYGALRAVAQSESRFGDAASAAATSQQADKLGHAINKIFWSDKAHRFLPADQRTQPAFYPDVVAQVYPWLADLPTAEGDPHQAWTHWRGLFASAWLQNRYDPHAWGLVALAALKAGDERTAACWRDRASSHRFDREWNVLEEAAFQAVSARTASLAAGKNCGELDAPTSSSAQDLGAASPAAPPSTVARP